MITIEDWLECETVDIAEIVAARASTAVVYLNGTRRWFQARYERWEDYTTVTAAAQRELNQLLYEHGLQTLIEPLLGYDLLSRGQAYLKLVVEQGLMQLVGRDYRDWFRELDVRVTFYGNWVDALTGRGFSGVVEALENLVDETAEHTRHKLVLGIFADEGLDWIISLSGQAQNGQALLTQYYGQAVGPIDLIIGSGQPAIWDLPLLDINKASLYFLQAPTFCLDRSSLRQMLYDHLYHRVNDDELYPDLSNHFWQQPRTLGLGRYTEQGWVAL